MSAFPLRVMFGLPGAHEDGHPFDKGDISVGHAVWIGREAWITSGLTIGNGAVVCQLQRCQLQRCHERRPAVRHRRRLTRERDQAAVYRRAG